MRAGAHPALEPRLVRPGDGRREDLGGYTRVRGRGSGIEGLVPEGLEAAALEAVEACPEEAITAEQ